MRYTVVALLAGCVGLAPVFAAEKDALSESSLLIRVERESRDDLPKLLSVGIPVVMEMRESLFVEGKPEHLGKLDDQGYTASILDDDPASSDYLVVGIRPDSSMEALREEGTVLHHEENWVLVRVVRGAPIETAASEKVFITRMPHEPLQMPKKAVRAARGPATDFTDPDPLVQAIVDQVLPSSIGQLWGDLTSNLPTETRLSTHQGCQHAAVYCHDLYQGLGLDAEYQQWNAAHAPNVVATQPGALYPDDVYIVIGHLDDLPQIPPAPGADDNASGSVTVLEAARVMSCYAFENTVKYLNVTGEEYGLLGSEAYADDAWARGENILGVINMDMNGWEGDGSPSPENLDINYNSTSEWLGLLFAECAQKYNTGLAVDAFYCPSLSASDHYPFWQKGWSAICGITDNEGYCGHTGYYPYYHTSSDTIANCGDPTFFHSAVKTSVATLAEMARPFKIITGSPSYACSSTIGILLGDRDLDTDPGLQETVVVEVWSNTEPAPESITLGERSANSMLFEGVVPTNLGPAVGGDGQVSVAPGDVVTVRYVDALDCDGAAGVTYTATAQIDCAAPVISNVAVGGVTGAEATITWDTDEPADSAVTFGAPTPGTTVTDPTLVTSHSLRLESLDECTAYSFSVTSADRAGNAATDDNSGAYYTFATGVDNQPGYPSTDTPLPIVDNTTFTSVITVSDTETVLDVDVRLNATHTYTGDLDIFLIGPNGARVELTTDNGGSGNNFVDTVFDDESTTPITSGSAPFTGSFQPEGSLATLDGQSAAGTWILEVTDDAGADQGTLEGWDLILTFPAAQCGPVGEYDSHQLQVDACSTGSAGVGNAQWDAGEQVEFMLRLHNGGTGWITAGVAAVTAMTPGVTMMDGVAAMDDVAPGATADSRAPHFIAHLSETLTCGTQLDFNFVLTSNEGSWPGTFQQTLGDFTPAQAGTVFSEDFSSATIPAGWTVVDGFTDGQTWFADNAGDPKVCFSPDPAIPPFAGSWAAVDSSCTGGGAQMDEELISPVIDLSGAVTATLEFDHWFEWDSQPTDELADVDVRSSNTGGAWVNVAQWTGASSPNGEHVNLDVTTEAAGAADVQVRFRYHDARVELYWYVDNITVDSSHPASCNMTTCAAPASAPPPIPDPISVDRLTASGSEVSVSWNDQCAPAGAKILYGPLDQVSSHTVTGSVCSISNPEVWTSLPAGDLWFVVVSDDGAGVESSWGLSSAGERNGLTGSGTCGSVTKDLTGNCP